MLDHDRLLLLLAEVRTGNDANQPMSNRLLVEHLGWSACEVAESLATARARLLIWGLRCSGEPRPQFDELELTVQGRRLLELQPATKPRARKTSARNAG